MTKAHATSTAALEDDVQRLGRLLLEKARTRQHNSWLGSLLNRLMADDRLRTRVLRFVDVLPALRSDQEIARHLDEYLGDSALPVGDLPLPAFFPAANWALHHTRRGLAAHVLAAGVRLVSHRMAGRFIAGSDAATVAPTLRRLQRQGLAFTLDLLGEATVSQPEADDYQRRYLRLLEELSPLVRRWPDNPTLDIVSGRRSPRLNVSIKASALDWRLDPVDPAGGAEAVKHRLRPILLAARARGAFVNLDMEQYDAKEITLRVFRELLSEPGLRDWPDVGIAMQAYLRDTPRDIAELIAWARNRGTPVTVRLVRGAYWDYETIIAQQNGWPIPVWTHKDETDACYEQCLRTLLENHPHVEAAIATHNVRSVAVAITLARALGLNERQYELQMLYGMADPLKQTLAEMGQRLRVYVPFGELIPGMAYLVRRLLENTSSQSFLRLGLEKESGEEPLLPPLPSEGEGWGEGLEFSHLGAKKQDKTLTPPSPSEGRGGQSRTFSNEPVHRFTDPAERDACAAAIEHVRGQLGKPYPLVIGGRRTKGAATVESLNPARPSEVVGVLAWANPKQAGDAIAAAVEAFPAWSQTPMEERAAVLKKTATAMRKRRDDLAAWEIFEAGKPWREADADVAEAIDFLEYYAAEAVVLGHGLTMNAPGETNDYFYEPRGPGAIIAPWNFPLAIVTGMASAAIVTGNTVVVKPAPQTPVVAFKLFEAFEEAGLPPGVLNFLPGDDGVGETLVRDPRIHFIAFTGSEAVGKRINVVGAEVQPGQQHLKKIIAEMGGKNAIIIDSDADLDDAVRGTMASAFGYAGQKCSAASRVIIVGDLHDLFVHRLVEAARGVRVGSPEEPGTVVGPVIDSAAHERIRRAIEEGDKIANLVLDGRLFYPLPLGGGREGDSGAVGGSNGAQGSYGDLSQSGPPPNLPPKGEGEDAPGYFIGPTIFTGVTSDSFLAQEEIFGPVLSVLRANDFDDALRIANSTRYALTGGVYSRSPANLLAARRRFRVGNLYLNRKITGALVGRQPFGGFKMSGVGSKAGGPDYLLQFVEPRCVTENTIRRGFAPE